MCMFDIVPLNGYPQKVLVPNGSLQLKWTYLFSGDRDVLQWHWNMGITTLDKYFHSEWVPLLKMMIWAWISWVRLMKSLGYLQWDQRHSYTAKISDGLTERELLKRCCFGWSSSPLGDMFGSVMRELLGRNLRPVNEFSKTSFPCSLSSFTEGETRRPILNQGSLTIMMTMIMIIMVITMKIIIDVVLALVHFQEYHKLERKTQEAEQEIKTMRLECKKRRRMIEIQQNCLFNRKDPTSFEKVSLPNALWLVEHIEIGID